MTSQVYWENIYLTFDKNPRLKEISSKSHINIFIDV